MEGSWLVIEMHIFHLRASIRRRKNLIKSLQKPYGEIIEDPTGMQQLAMDFFIKICTCLKGCKGYLR